MEILVIHPGALGDIFLALPALDILRRSYPGRVVLAGNIDGFRKLGNGYADRYFSIHALPLHRLYGSSALTDADLGFWRSFERIISWTGAGDEQFCDNLTRIHRRVLISRWKPAEADGRHISQIFVDSLRPWLGRSERASAAKITLSDEDRACGIEWLKNAGWSGKGDLIAIHPGAGSLSKRWPLPKFQRLASDLLSRPAREILVIEGPAESGLGKELAAHLPSPGCLLSAGMPLNLLSSILMWCRVYVGNDAGLAHLAAALCTPCVLIFGPTNPEQWAPLGAHVYLHRDDTGFTKVSVNQVLDTVEQLIH